MSKIPDIVFRALLKDENRWIYGVPTLDNEQSYMFKTVIKAGEPTKGRLYPIRSETLGQRWNYEDKYVFGGDLFSAIFAYNADLLKIGASTRGLHKVVETGFGIIFSTWYINTWITSCHIDFSTMEPLGDIYTNPDETKNWGI